MSNKYIDVWLNGRLGNVLFQLAHFYSFHDNLICNITNQQLPFIKDLKDAFGLNFKIKLNRKFIPDKEFGYFQSENLFDVEKIKNKFRFTDNFIKRLDEEFKSINYEKYVSMTIRRGDYITKNGMWLYFNADVYNELYEKYFDGLPCIISSDDIQWCKDNIKVNHPIFANEITNNSVELLYVLSKCKHTIGSASSFSWWVAWLNEYQDSINIFPDRWYDLSKVGKYYPTEDVEQIVPSRWLKVKYDK